MTEFKSFGAFAAHLERLAAESKAVEHHMLDKSAEEIQKTARGIIGEYQEAIGSYPAWEELAESTQAERGRLGYSENDPGYRSGAMQASVQRKVEGSESVVGSDDMHLYWFDLGTATQPPRPVLGPAAMHSSERVKKIMGLTLFAWLSARGWRRPRISGD